MGLDVWGGQGRGGRVGARVTNPLHARVVASADEQRVLHYFISKRHFSHTILALLVMAVWHFVERDVVYLF